MEDDSEVNERSIQFYRTVDTNNDESEFIGESRISRMNSSVHS